MKFNKEWLKLNWVPYTVATCSAVILYFLLSHLGLVLNGLSGFLRVIQPVLVGILFAYLMDPIARFFQKKVFHKVKIAKMNRSLSVISAILTVVLAFALLLLAFIPQLAKSVSLLIGNMSEYMTALERSLARWNSANKLGIKLDMNTIKGFGDTLIKKVSEIKPENLSNFAQTSSNVGNGVFNVVVGFILAIYLMMDKERLVPGIQRFLQSILKEKKYRGLAEFCSKCDAILLRYVICDLADSAVVGVLNAIFMLIAGLPYASLISVVVGLTNLAPTFGPLVGAIIGAFVLVLVNPVYALWFLIFTVVLQTLDGYIIKPKIFGDSLGVSALWILVAIVVGGRMLGVVGILLAIPCAAIIDFMGKDFVAKRLPPQEETE